MNTKTLATIACALACAGTANAASVTYNGSIGGVGAQRNVHSAVLLNPDQGPIAVSGQIDATGLTSNSAIMVGLLDSSTTGNDNLLGSGDARGAWGYFGERNGGWRVGPSNGFVGGEIIGGGTNLSAPDFADPSSNVIKFSMLIDGSGSPNGEGQITFSLFDPADSASVLYTEVLNYDNASFANGAELFVDAWFSAESGPHDYTLTVTAIPLPSGAGLAALGLGLAAIRRRR